MIIIRRRDKTVTRQVRHIASRGYFFPVAVSSTTRSCELIQVCCSFLFLDRHWRTDPFDVTHAPNFVEELGPNWRDLGRALEIKEAVLSNIDEENKRIKDKCYAVITRWQRLQGKEVTKGRFADALLAIGRKDIAENLGEYYFLFIRIVPA